MTNHPSIDPGVTIGVVRLKVRELERSLYFYNHILGFTELRREDGTVWLTANGINPLVALVERPDAAPLPSRNVAGLYHFAILLPDQRSLGLSLRRLAEFGVPIGQGDHLVSEALYISIPTGTASRSIGIVPAASGNMTAAGMSSWARSPSM